VADELLVGTVLRAEQHPGARAPSLLLTVDLGPRGEREAVLSTGTQDADALVGSQVVCRLADDAATVVGAQSHARGVVVVRPDGEVEPGTVVA